LLIAAFGALSFPVEASGARLNDAEKDAIIKELNVKAFCLVGEIKKTWPSVPIDKLKVLQSLVARVERKKAETELFFSQHSELKELLDKMNAASYEGIDKEQVKFRNWFLFLYHDSDQAGLVNNRLEQIKKHCEQLNLLTKQEFDNEKKLLSPEDFSIFRDRRLDAIKVAFVDLFGTQESINQRERFSQDDEAGKKAQQPVQGAESDPVSPEGATKPSTSSAGSSATQDQQAQQGSQVHSARSATSRVDSKRDVVGQPQAPQGNAQQQAPQAPQAQVQTQESKSIIPQVVRNHPLAFGLGGGAAVLALLVAKIKADYDKNPPVDESGEITPFNKHLASEFISLNATKMNFWIKATALGLAGAGIYLKSTAAAA
jgi:hypothetical protein